MVIVAPHPDDEVLACGATLAMHAARDGESLLVAVTDGEASHHDTPDRATRTLAERRRRERRPGPDPARRSFRVVIRLALPDGHVDRHVLELADRLTACLRPNDVVFATWRHDGHPDHEATGRAAASARAATGCLLVEAPVWMWHWAQPGDGRVPWDRLRC